MIKILPESSSATLKKNVSIVVSINEFIIYHYFSEFHIVQVKYYNFCLEVMLF
jgi:hypothetical protein